MASELRVDRIIPVNGVPTGGGGGIVQVVQASTNTQVNINTQTYTDTGLSATITPRFASSKILVITNHQIYAASTGDNDFYFGIRYLRDSTTIFTPTTDSNGPFDYGVAAYGASATRVWYSRCSPPEFLDSPNTTSAVTYKTQARTYSASNNANVYFQYDTTTDGTSYITLMEVSG
jgi:hypothetical protein